jgi:PAS domain S-box-containing protein
MEKQQSRERAGKFLIAIFAPAAVAGFMQLTWPFFQTTPTSLFFLAIMFSAWYGGLAPGLLSTFVSLLLADYFFIEPYFALWPPATGNLVRLITLVSVGSFISILSELMHRTRRRVEDNLRSAQQADEARRLVEERYHTLFDQSPDGILIADGQSNYLDANASMCRMLGYTRDELIGLNASDIVTQSEIEHIGEALNVITGKSDYHREWQFRRKDDSVFEGEVIATAMPDGNLLGLVRDISERKQAEEKLRLSEDQFRTMANSIPQLAWIAHADGFIFWYNQRWHNYAGTTPLEMAGWGWQSVHDPEVLPKVMERWQNAIAIGQPFEMEFPLRGADGQFRAFLTRVQPLKDSQGVVVQWFGTNTDVDELKRMQESLRRQADLLEQSHDAIFVWELGGEIEYWNRSAELLYGFTKAEALGHVTHELLRTEHSVPTKQFEDELRQSGRWEGELRQSAKDGRKITVESRHIVVQQEAAGTYVLETNRDITARKRAEEDRKRFFELSADVFCTLGFDGYFKDLNPAWEKTLGYTKSELVSTPFIEFIHPDDREATLIEAEKVAAGKALIAFENRYRCRDGSYRCFQWSVTPVIEEQVMYGVARDITERKRTEQALHESEEYFHFLNDLSEATRTLADPAQIMSVMARMLGQHLHASRCAYADVARDGEQFTIVHDYTDGCASTVGNYQLTLFGARAVATLHSGQTLVIRNVETELAPDEGADMFNAIGIKAIITCPLVKEGDLRAMMAVHQTTPRDWKEGEIAIVQDVVERCWATIERRTAEEQIHQLNNELEQRVTERTSQLGSVNQELEAFSYSISHDLRAPLRGVDGYVRMLKEDCADQLDAEGHRLLDVVSSEAKRMGQLIDDLLSFSRLGREQMDSTTIDMTALAGDVFENLNRTAPEFGARFELKSLPPARGDLSMLRQVFVNLIDNAGKFTRHQSLPVIEVGGGSGDGEITYYVRDNGVGFDEKYSHKLFGVFQRLHSEEEFEGTGVGLALVQRVIHRHGGKVWAEGKLNQGATFFFTLPIRTGAVNE